MIALGLVALTVYELSPKTRSRVDDYARAIRSARAAHRAADAHLDNARAATGTAARLAQQGRPAASSSASPATLRPASGPGATPSPVPTSLPEADPVDAPAQAAVDDAVEQVADATEANQAAAQSTAEAAAAAQTPSERQAVVESAAKVDKNARQIAEALRTLGLGQCGARTYRRITAQVKDALLVKLRAEGMTVSGNNPWNIDTQQYGVRLRAVWDPRAALVKLIVTTGKGTQVIPFVKEVTCQDIWDKIDPIMKEVTG